ncbi:signal transducing adapter molecule 2-like isoform X2 [Pomacea canaliculata]|uniref:signal transducing adapter molecule 2-like isoform X2 n=1 Tax=Pomacea canaliculata TaxID=400727 RepID=UPI000D726538|nr:signal transducing adapter molecule 2-like isoform X2 [Pomacea canaliculata]
MPLFANASPFDPEVEKATHEFSTSEDWSLILDICEKVGRQPNGARDCLKSIVKRLNHKVPFVAKQALTLLDACVNNCGRPFHLEICSRDFVSECRTLINQKAHPKVAQKLKFMIKRWAEMPEFKDDAALSLIPSFYESLKKEGADFSDPDVAPKSSDPSQVAKEEDDIAKAIALSLQEADKGQPKTSALYPTSSYPPVHESRPREIRKVRALYDFEAAEDNELTFKGGELISVLDDSDPNWWKGFNHRGEGLFPANFVTADLSVEPEETKEKKSVQFSEEVEVKTLEPLPDEVEIDESKINEVLNLIQNADPTGETCPDTPEMLSLEEQCKAMGPLIDAELEKIDRKHTALVEVNQRVMDALQMYHTLMRENPAYSFPKTSHVPPPYASLPSVMGSLPPQPQMGQPAYNGQTYMSPPGHLGSGPSISQPPAQTFSPPPANQNYSSLPAVNAAVGSMITTPATTLAGATAAAASSDNLKGSAVMVGSQSLPPISMQQQLPQPYQNGSMVTTLPHTYTAAPSQSLHSMPTTVTYQPPAQPLL